MSQLISSTSSICQSNLCSEQLALTCPMSTETVQAPPIRKGGWQHLIYSHLSGHVINNQYIKLYWGSVKMLSILIFSIVYSCAYSIIITVPLFCGVNQNIWDTIFFFRIETNDQVYNILNEIYHRFGMIHFKHIASVLAGKHDLQHYS